MPILLSRIIMGIIMKQLISILFRSSFFMSPTSYFTSFFEALIFDLSDFISVLILDYALIISFF